MIATNHYNRSIAVKNIKIFGDNLHAAAATSADKRYPATSNGKDIALTSTDAFNYLVRKHILPDKKLIYNAAEHMSPPSDIALSDMTSSNVSFNYMVANVDGVEGSLPITADDYLPLLWTSGHDPIAVKDGMLELKLNPSAAWGCTGAIVYYKNGMQYSCETQKKLPSLVLHLPRLRPTA